MTTSLVVQEQSALANYGNKDELKEMTDRLLGLHPAASEVGNGCLTRKERDAFRMAINGPYIVFCFELATNT